MRYVSHDFDCSMKYFRDPSTHAIAVGFSYANPFRLPSAVKRHVSRSDAVTSETFALFDRSSVRRNTFSFGGRSVCSTITCHDVVNNERVYWKPTCSNTVSRERRVRGRSSLRSVFERLKSCDSRFLRYFVTLPFSTTITDGA